MANSTFRDAIDPNYQLPEVTFVRDPNAADNPRGTRRIETYDVMHGEQKIGSSTVVRDLKTNEAWFNGVKVDPELRGQGFGTATYARAIEDAHDRGETFRSHDYSLTPEAAKVWQRFVDQGVATVVDPLEPVIIEGHEHFIGSVHVPPKTT